MKSQYPYWLLAAAVVLAVTLSSSAQNSEKTEGANIFRSNCAMCHGPDGKGNTPVGRAMHIPDLASAAVQDKSDAQLTSAIDAGKGKMPAFKTRLSPEQVKDVVAYVRQLSTPGKSAGVAATAPHAAGTHTQHAMHGQQNVPSMQNMIEQMNGMMGQMSSMMQSYQGMGMGNQGSMGNQGMMGGQGRQGMMGSSYPAAGHYPAGGANASLPAMAQSMNSMGTSMQDMLNEMNRAMSNQNLMSNPAVKSNLEAMQSHMAGMLHSMQGMIHNMEQIQNAHPESKE